MLMRGSGKIGRGTTNHDLVRGDIRERKVDVASGGPFEILHGQVAEIETQKYQVEFRGEL